LRRSVAEALKRCKKKTATHPLDRTRLRRLIFSPRGPILLHPHAHRSARGRRHLPTTTLRSTDVVGGTCFSAAACWWSRRRCSTPHAAEIGERL